MGKKIEVVSRVGNIGFSLPYQNFSRTWPRDGAKLLIDEDILREAFYQVGVEYMFKQGMLYINDPEFRKELGLDPIEIENEDGSTDVINPVLVDLDNKLMERACKFMPIVEFKKLVKKLTKEQINMLVNYAVANKMTDYDKCELLHELTKVDIHAAIKLRKQAEE